MVRRVECDGIRVQLCSSGVVFCGKRGVGLGFDHSGLVISKAPEGRLTSDIVYVDGFFKVKSRKMSSNPLESRGPQPGLLVS